jgi:dihydropyrimidinase
MTLLIRNGTLVTAAGSTRSDLLVEGGTIARIGPRLEAGSAQVIDAAGKLVMPGGVDPHTHFDLPMFGTVSSDDHYTGHKAAAFGSPSFPSAPPAGGGGRGGGRAPPPPPRG